MRPPCMALGLVLLRPLVPFLEGFSTLAVLGAGLAWGAISLSKSPAAVLGLVTETRSRGPLTEYSLGMVVVFDVLVLLVFSVCLALGGSLMDPEQALSLDQLRALGHELLASTAAGTTLGLLVAAWLWAVRGERLLSIVVLSYAATAFCRYFHYDTLLVFMLAGFVVQNVSRQGRALVHTVEQVSSGVMVLFFATAGASLDVDALRASWVAALALVGLRMGLTWVGCQLGHRWAKDPAPVRAYGHLALIPQAGVTFGLLSVMAVQLPAPVGTGLAGLGIALVAVNQLLGPVLFKWGLARAGELGTAPPPAEPAAE
ncbi:MAG: cation:proton antiporter [Deltaproteobacteria bacterium]|nr:cation:proton antiporter [Deltaproteobacteria bacterium]